MSSETPLSIIDRRLKLAGERKRMIEDLIKSYDQKVFNPAMTLLREDCTAEGHEPIGGGKSRVCGKCGKEFIGNGR
jgi:hypothetical protein